MQIDWETMQASGFDDEEAFNQAVADFRAAKEAHAQTVGVPAPIAHPLVEAAAASGSYDVLSEPEPEPLPIKAVSPRQARLALLDAGLLDQVETELAKPENKAALISWEYATVVQRDSDLVITIGASLGLNEAQIDALFEAAAGL